MRNTLMRAAVFGLAPGCAPRLPGCHSDHGQDHHCRKAPMLTNAPLRAVVYGLATVWGFLGIAVATAMQTSAIEVITSAKRTITGRDATGAPVAIDVLVWNASVANLLLLALGSSAPAITLTIINTATTLGHAADELGPATIVGAPAALRRARAGACNSGILLLLAPRSAWRRPRGQLPLLAVHTRRRAARMCCLLA
jgi:Sodium/calcium exchanger protein